MRLIDADELAPLVKRLIEMAPTVDTPKELICSVTVDTDEIIERIKERGWEPVKHGRWIHEVDTGADMLKCSECSCRVVLKWYKIAVGTAGYEFCPYCGAKMDGEDDEID